MLLPQQQSQQKTPSEKSRSKKGKEPKPRVKKLKYHQYVPPDQKQEASEAPMDSSYARLLQQQQLFLQLQILSQQQQHYNYQTILPAPLKYAYQTLPISQSFMALCFFSGLFEKSNTHFFSRGLVWLSSTTLYLRESQILLFSTGQRAISLFPTTTLPLIILITHRMLLHSCCFHECPHSGCPARLSLNCACAQWFG